MGLGCDVTHTCVAGACTDTRTAQVVQVDAGPSVRCGDNGVYCPTSGNVCCLSVDQDAGTTFGECKDPAHCPNTSIVLNCDDETDCASFADDAGHPGICATSYVSFSGAHDGYMPTSVQLSQCVGSQPFVQSFGGIGLELCESRQGCFNQQFHCQESNGGPVNPLPGYFWCDIKL
ncbi:MAG TPA: hypothetical protein VNW92_12775 [Polyangiaceae bacterium]|nr:hypothetical protein [Polyangiaceae bacterium]